MEDQQCNLDHYQRYVECIWFKLVFQTVLCTTNSEHIEVLLKWKNVSLWSYLCAVIVYIIRCIYKKRTKLQRDTVDTVACSIRKKHKIQNNHLIQYKITLS